jgi:hypothetical protein
VLRELVEDLGEILHVDPLPAGQAVEPLDRLRMTIQTGRVVGQATISPTGTRAIRGTEIPMRRASSMISVSSPPPAVLNPRPSVGRRGSST